MIKPRPEDVREFENYSVDNFKTWLGKGLEDYLLKEDVWSFGSVAVFIGQDEHLSLDLRNIYEVLSKEAQEKFHQAVKELNEDGEYKKEGKKLILENILYLKNQLG